MDYDKDLGDLSITIVSTVATAVLGAVFGGGLPGALGGGVLGAVIRFGLSELKDTSNFTAAFRDVDKSVAGVTDAALQPLVSGIWMDEDTDMLTYDDDVPLVHLEDLPVGAEVGTEKTYDIP